MGTKFDGKSTLIVPYSLLKAGETGRLNVPSFCSLN